MQQWGNDGPATKPLGSTVDPLLVNLISLKDEVDGLTQSFLRHRWLTSRWPPGNCAITAKSIDKDPRYFVDSKRK